MFNISKTLIIYLLFSFYKATCKGAPEVLKSMFKDLPENYDDIYLHFAREGARVLALGHKELGQLSHQQIRDTNREDIESGLKFTGFVVISCPLKPDTKAVVKEILNSSHHVTMITGDNPLTACHVTSQLRLIDKKNALVLSRDENLIGDSTSSWFWKSVINDDVQKELRFALEQQKYVKPSKKTAASEESAYNYLCLTGEVCLFFYLLKLELLKVEIRQKVYFFRINIKIAVKKKKEVLKNKLIEENQFF